MPIVRVPDGRLVRFPDDMPNEEIKSFIASKFPEEVKDLQPKPGFTERVGEDLNKRMMKAGDIGSAIYQQTGPETAWQAGTNAIGALGDVAGEGFVSAGKYAGDAANYFAPETTQAVVKGVKELGSDFANTEIGKAILSAAGKGAEGISEFAKNNPRAARNLGGIGDLALGVPLIKGAKPIVEGVGELGLEATKKIGDATIGNVARGTTNLYKGMTARDAEDLINAGNAIKQQSSGAYKNMREIGAILKPESTNRIVKNIDNVLANSGKMNKKLHGDTLSVIGDIKTAAKKGELGLEELDQYRQLLSDAVRKNTTKLEGANPDAFKASQAIEAIDDIVDRLAPTDLAKGEISAIHSLNNARAEWNRYKKFDTISKIVERSEGDANYLKRELKKLSENPKRLKGFSKEERLALKEAAKLSTGEGILKMIGKFGLDLGGSRAGGNAVAPILGSLGGGAALGSTPAGLGILATGTAARSGQKYIARGKTENLLKAIEKKK